MLKLNYLKLTMNKKGSVMIYSIMLGLVIIVTTLALAPAGKEFIDSAMNESVGDTIGMDCDNESISNFDKAACVVTDFSLFYFFGGLIFIAGLIVTGRILFT